jgi:hypothetical protein
VVYWVIARLQPQGVKARAAARLVERLGPFASQELAMQAREAAATRYLTCPDTRVEVVCDFS